MGTDAGLLQAIGIDDIIDIDQKKTWLTVNG